MNFLLCDWRGFSTLPFLLLLALGSSTAQQPANTSSARTHNAGRDKDQTGERLLSVDLRPRSLPALSADAVVEKMMATSARRSAQLHGFRTTRTYDLQYHGFLGTRGAGMKVLSTYTAPDKLEFSILSQTGSKLLLNRVLLKLLDSEREAFRNQSQVALNPANYTFDSEGVEQLLASQPCYVLGVNPRKENKFLYRGKVWIDGYDFALAHMEGRPAKSPSFWIRDTQIDSSWAKVGEYWLIQHSRSVSHVRMGGRATLTIDYSDYQITASGRAHGRGQNAQLPDPSAVTPQR